MASSQLASFEIFFSNSQIASFKIFSQMPKIIDFKIGQTTFYSHIFKLSLSLKDQFFLRLNVLGCRGELYFHYRFLISVR